MKATEFMIGDLVNIYVFPNDKPTKKDLFPAKITSILTPLPSETKDVEHVECIFKPKDKKSGFGVASRPADTCLPIPITAKLLEKNGFPNDGGYFSIDNEVGGSMIEIWEPDGEKETWGVDLTGADGTCKINIEYVHQLQHALRLCGIDKEITI